MAPSHSFDRETERALRETKFRAVTDGLALYPFLRDGLPFVPQVFSVPPPMLFGVFTFLVHPNTLDESGLTALCHSCAATDPDSSTSTLPARFFQGGAGTNQQAGC
jgi:Uncharacterized protein conserved in bacteria (DUF2334)